MFAHDCKCIQNHFYKNIENKNFYFTLNIHLNWLQIKRKMCLYNFNQTKQMRVVCGKMSLWLREHYNKWTHIKFIFDKYKMFWMMKLTYEFVFKCVWFKT